MQAQADYKKTAEKDVKSFVQNWEFPYGVEMATNSQDESMGEELSALYPDCDVEVHMGGQPLYYYLLSVE